MRGRNVLSLSVVVTLACSLSVAAQVPSGIHATGWITDTRCGAKGANAQHVECAKRNVASGKAKYALYDERSRKLYILEPQETAALYLALGQRVKITGTLNFSAQQQTEVLTIAAIELLPPPSRRR